MFVTSLRFSLMHLSDRWLSFKYYTDRVGMYIVLKDLPDIYIQDFV